MAQWFPEVGAGGYTSIDGTVEFCGRVQALLRPDMHVLDFGAGRGAALLDDAAGFRNQLRLFRGKAANVVACDVDEAVLDNPGADRTIVIQADAPLPFDDGAFDLIVSDFVFRAHCRSRFGFSRTTARPEAWRLDLPAHSEQVLPDLAGDASDPQLPALAVAALGTTGTQVDGRVPNCVQAEQQA